jgi:copper transport protein
VRSTVWRAAAAAALALAFLLAAPAAARAHAFLQSTSPASGAVLKQAPARVSLTFDEKVYVKLGFLRVFGPDGTRVDAGTIRYGPGDGSVVTVALRGELDRGTYAVGWRVVSDDGHPISGAFAFSIGVPSAAPAHARAAAGPGGSQAVTVLYGVARWLGYAGFALLAGGLIFVLACWPAGIGALRTRRLLYGGLAVLAVVTTADILLEGPYTRALGLGAALRADVLQATLQDTFGQATLIRLLLLGLALPYLRWLSLRWPAARPATRAERAGLSAIGLALAVTLAVTWAMTGHSSVGHLAPLAMAADCLHLLSMAAWAGGLVVLAVVVLRRGPAGAVAGPAETTAVARFSKLAFACVAVLVVTGLFQAWRQLGVSMAFATTGYGQLLVAKTAGLIVLVFLGAHARRVLAGEAPWRLLAWTVPGRRDTAPAASLHREAVLAGRPAASGGPGLPETGTPVSDSTGREPPTFARLRRGVLVEILLVAAILAVAAVLVDTAPPRAARVPATPGPATAAPAYRHAHERIQYQAQTVRFGPVPGADAPATLKITVTHSSSGLNGLYLRVGDRSGRALPVSLSIVSFRQSATGLGPIQVSAIRAGPGNFIVNPLVLPRAGSWRVSVTVRSAGQPQSTAVATVVTR